MSRKLFCEGWKVTADQMVWRGITLPHDATLEQGRSEDAPGGASDAYFLGGKYTYEKSFTIPAEDVNNHFVLEFEGVYPRAKVFLNGIEVGACDFGYSRFLVELKDLKVGEENIIRVDVDDEGHPNSRWYAGAGIYRPVWIYALPKDHIAIDGVKVTTLSHSPAQIRVETKVESSVGVEGYKVITEILDGEKILATMQGSDCVINLENVELWSADKPKLYTCYTVLEKNGEKLDEQVTKFGVRTLQWSSKGFFVNGESVKLKGGCIHADGGVLGAKTIDLAEWRRVKKMKEFGFNAIRSAHHPMTRALLEACDALGMYVMDELYDTWTNTKSAYDFGNGFVERYETDIQQMVAKDYNHPCVVMYSIGNEVTEPATPEGVELGGKIADAVRSKDSTRPITAGINLTLLLMAEKGINLTINAGNKKDEKKVQDQSSMEQMDSTAFNKMVSEQGKKMVMAAATEDADRVSSPILDKLDISGYNYASSRYEQEGELHPDRIVVGSETYPQDIIENWEMVEKYPYLIGDFMWTVWDYIGEVGIGAWTYDAGDKGFGKQYPWLLADTGAFDILGNDNAEAAMAAVAWKSLKEPYIGVKPVNHPGVAPAAAMWRGTNAIPYWSYKDCDGFDAEVEVYADACKIQLLLNGKEIGREKIENKKCILQTKYEPGELKAVAFDENGVKVGESSLNSADDKTMISICLDDNAEAIRNLMGQDAYQKDQILYFNIDLTGENGEIECNADRELHVSVEGGELLGFGSARPKTEESFLSGRYTTYYGRSLAVVRKTEESVVITVTGEGLKDKKICM